MVRPTFRGGLYGPEIGSHTPIWLCRTYIRWCVLAYLFVTHSYCYSQVRVTRVHTGGLVGLMIAQIGHYNLLRCRRYKKIVLDRRYYRGDRRANYRRANCLKYCKQIVFEIFAQLSAL